jgi:AcrR family transcriptional regulator
VGRIRTFEEADVLEAATNLFWENGFAGTSVDDVLQASGLGKGSLYAAFGGKRQLFGRVFDGYCKRVGYAFEHALAGPDATAARRIRALLRGTAKRGRDRVAGRPCLLAKTTSEMAASDREIAVQARATLLEMVAALRNALTQAQDAGDVAPDVDVDKGAHLLIVTLRGIEALAQAGVSTAILSDAAEAALEAVTLSK